MMNADQAEPCKPIFNRDEEDTGDATLQAKTLLGPLIKADQIGSIKSKNKGFMVLIKKRF